MSADPNSKKKKRRDPASKIAARVICLVLAALMLAGSLYYVIIFLIPQARAQNYDADCMIRVGLMYGDNVTTGFETTAEYGFLLGAVDESGRFTALTQTSDTVVSAVCDGNLDNTNSTFTKTNSVFPSVGGYHIELAGSGLMSGYSAVSAVLAGLGYVNIFPAYINGSFRVRAGSFGSYDSAYSAAAAISPEVFADTGVNLTISVAIPSSTAVAIVLPSTNRIIFELDSGDNSGGSYTLGIEPMQRVGEETAYLVTPAKNEYAGIFEFKRNGSAYKDGVALTNILTLEEYTEGVLPYEIGNSWPLEAQKAFAVAVRSYAVSNLGRHSADYGCDLCNSTHCQVYKGRLRVNDTVVQAVAETKGVVLTYNGDIVRAFYSSSTGGTTVSAADAWGSDPASYPYLAAKATPWEHYAEHDYGEWTFEVSPTELLSALRAKGYTLLRGAIANITIDKVAENSTYVTQLTFYDVYGTAVTIKRSDTIRSVLSGYVRSANFSVALAGQTVTLTDYYYADALNAFGISGKSGTSEPVAVEVETPAETTDTSLPVDLTDPSTGSGSYILPGSLSVITASGTKTLGGNGGNDADSYTAITASGALGSAITGGSISVLSSDGEQKYLLPDTSELTGNTMQSDNTVDSTASASSEASGLPKLPELNIVAATRNVIAIGASGNFVFVGRGYGHGVGMSQWGVRDLAVMGYNYIDILEAYYPGTEAVYLDGITG